MIKKPRPALLAARPFEVLYLLQSGTCSSFRQATADQRRPGRAPLRSDKGKFSSWLEATSQRRSLRALPPPFFSIHNEKISKVLTTSKNWKAHKKIRFIKKHFQNTPKRRKRKLNTRNGNC